MLETPVDAFDAREERERLYPNLNADLDWVGGIDYVPVYQQRVERLVKIRDDAELLGKVLAYYKDSPVDFINDWMMTFDPRKLKSPFMPFLLFPRQVEYILWLKHHYESQTDGVTDKSRDMGVTWLCMAFAIWMWRFHPGSKVGFGSRKEAYVDRIGDPDSIFEKARLILQRLPVELLPSGFKIDEHCPFMKIINPENGSTITGESGDNIGRGGRSSMYFKDESAFYERPERIEAALSQNSNVKIDVSTHNGTGTIFYRKCVNKVLDVFEFDWRDDPRKDMAWYEEQKRILDPVILAQEVDRDPSSAIENILIPQKWIRASQELRRNKMVDFKPPSIGTAGLDVGGGKAQNVFIAGYGPWIMKAEHWPGDDTIETAYKARNLMHKYNIEHLNYDSISVGQGVTASFRRMADVNVHPVNVGRPASAKKGKDGKRASDKFKNIKAELWWMAREMFLKAYELYLYLTGNGGFNHPVEEIILMDPDDEVTASQLGQVCYIRQTDGKIAVESKESLASRGIKSPDFAEAFILRLRTPLFKKVTDYRI